MCAKGEWCFERVITIEKGVMEKLSISYEEGGKGTGCIAMMVVRRKSELSKTTMK